MNLRQIQDIAGHRNVSPWVITLVQDCIEHDRMYEREKIEAAVLAEREACAKVCAHLVTPWDENTPNGELIAIKNSGMVACAAAIRARGE